MSSPPPLSNQAHAAAVSGPVPISPEAAEAAERRNRQSLETAPQQTAAMFLQEHERRLKFRRLLDPGITRPNPKEQAISSIKTLSKIAENLIREPDNPKFQQFKPTNSVIKRELVDRKGTLEFAIELGFKPEVQNFQPYYKFHHRHLDDLRIGAQILEEFLTHHREKEERIALSKQNEKAAAEEAATKVKLAYMDDRKTKMQRDELERQAREARATRHSSEANRPTGQHSPLGGPSAVHIPGEGRSLTSPPPYEESAEREEIP